MGGRSDGLSAMNFRWAGPVLLLLVACTEPPSVPLSASTAVQPTNEGLASLFRGECIQQRNRRWVLEQSRRRRAACHNFMTNEGKAGDCELEVGNVSWTAPIAGGSSAQVEFEWWRDGQEPPSTGPINCRLLFYEHEGLALQSVAEQIAQADLAFTLPPLHRTTSDGERWEWRDTEDSRPQLLLSHGRLTESCPSSVYFECRDWRPHQWSLAITYRE